MVKKEKLIPSEDENTDVTSSLTSKYWNTNISDQQFIDLYNFNGIATRATDKYVGDLTSDKYELKDQQLQKLREDLEIDEKINYATERAFIVGVSFIYMGFADGAEISDPVSNSIVADFLQVIPKSWFELDEEDQPKLNVDGQYKINLKGGSSILVHESRLIEISLRKDKKSSLMPAFRSLTVTDNNLWSMGQSFYRNAAGLTHVKITNPKKTRVDGKLISETDTIKEKGIFDDINSQSTIISDDRYEVTMHGVQGTKPSVKETWEASLIQASIDLKIPFQLLVGTAAGQLTGSEQNAKDYFGEINNKRIKFMNNFFNRLYNSFGFNIPVEVEYDTLFEETDVEKAEIFNKDMTSISLGVEKGVITADTAANWFNEKHDTEFKAGEGFEQGQSIDPGTPVVGDQGGSVIVSKVFVPEEFTKEEATRMVQHAGYNSNNYEFKEFDGHVFYQVDPRVIVPLSEEYKYLDGNITEVRAIIDPVKFGKLELENKQMEAEKQSAEFIPESEVKQIDPNVQLIPQLSVTSDATFTPELVPKSGSIWEQPKFMRRERANVNSLIKTFDESWNFDNLSKALKDDVQFSSDNFFQKIKNNIFRKDAEAEAILLIDQQAAGFEAESKIVMGIWVDKSLVIAREEAERIVKKAVRVSQRTIELEKAMRVATLDKISGATEDMKKDLRRVLHESLVNETSAVKAANNFKKYVSTDFAKKYKGRMELIATQETNNVFNTAAQDTYLDAKVKFNQWLHSGQSNGRPEHIAIHGQVVETGKAFSIGCVRPPCGVRCKCAIVPYFGREE